MAWITDDDVKNAALRLGVTLTAAEYEGAGLRAERAVEKYLGYPVLQAAYDSTFEAPELPNASMMHVIPVLTAVATVTANIGPGSSGTPMTQDTDFYAELFELPDSTEVIYGFKWWTLIARKPHRIRVTGTKGVYADAGSVPADLKQLAAMLEAGVIVSTGASGDRGDYSKVKLGAVEIETSRKSNFTEWRGLSAKSIAALDKAEGDLYAWKVPRVF